MDVNSVIDNLAEKFGTTVPYLISEMQKYYIIGESSWVITCLIITIISIIIGKKLINKGLAIKKEDKWGDWEMPIIFGCSAFVITLVFGIGTIVSIKHLLQWLITPTASALAEILMMISR